MIMSLMFAAGGFILLFLYHRREKAYDPLKTNLGILCTISWGVAGKFIASLLVSCMVADSVHLFLATIKYSVHMQKNVAE